MIVAAWFYLRHSHSGKKSKSKDVAIAHSQRITKLPTYQRLYKRYRMLLVLLLAGGLLLLVTTFVVTTRPVSQDLVSPQQKNRDIMLCLDVSGSMITVDKEIFKTFLNLVDGFEGQRVGLTTFNSSAVTILPLTDDYDLIRSYLKKGISGFELIEKDKFTFDYKSQAYKDYRSIVDGTTSNTDAGASIIGDGIASCINRMGANEQNRSQSIILGTDNELYGEPIITTLEAAAYAKTKNIRIYALDPGPSNTFESTAKEHVELQQAAELTGGSYSSTKDVSVQEIIADISQQEAALFTAPPEIVRKDTPLVFIIIISTLVVGLMIAAWRLKL